MSNATKWENHDGVYSIRIVYNVAIEVEQYFSPEELEDIKEIWGKYDTVYVKFWSKDEVKEIHIEHFDDNLKSSLEDIKWSERVQLYDKFDNYKVLDEWK